MFGSPSSLARRSSVPNRGRSVFLAGLLLLATATVARPALSQGRPAAVGVDPVVEEPLAQSVPVIGRFVARFAGDVSARVAGPVSAVDADVGDRVAAGAPLIQLDSTRIAQRFSLTEAQLTEARAAVAAAEAEAQRASQDLDRIRGLNQSAAFSQARLDEARQEQLRTASLLEVANARLQNVETQVDQAMLDLEDATIRAPYAGIVTRRLVSPGEYVQVGEPVIGLINDRDLEIEAQVSTERVVGLSQGRAVTVSLAAGTDLPATVRAVVPLEDPQSRTRTVRFTPGFAPADYAVAGNQTVTVRIPVGEERQIVSVHKDAVQIGPGGTSLVYVVVDGVAQPRTVELGTASGDRFEVLSGLAVGDVAVVRGNERLRPGQPVEPTGGANGPPPSDGETAGAS